MTRIIRSAALGLLWLALSATAFGTSLTVKEQNFFVLNAGGFSAYTNDPNSLMELFCADYLNQLGPFPDTYNANISTPTSLANITSTRYGLTPQASFLVQTVPVGQPLTGASLGDAVNRYLLSAWLTTQYDFSAGANNLPKDQGIQSAIWALLSVVGVAPNVGDTNVWLNNAVAWQQGQSMSSLAAFAANVRIYTSDNVAGVRAPTRYTTGKQELINVVPEPAAFLLLGTGLLGIGMIARRRKKA